MRDIDVRRHRASASLADFLYGPRDAAGADSYVLCEINVSSCFAIPDQAPAAIASQMIGSDAAEPRARGDVG